MSMHILKAIAERRSIRAYLDEAVSQEDLDTIIAAGRCAPCAGTFHMSVVRDPRLLQTVDSKTHEAMLGCDVPFLRARASLPGYRPLYGAPVLILLSSPSGDPSGAVSAALAAENMMLQATESGLGSCFLRSLTRVFGEEENKTLAREVGIPEGYLLHCGVALGHAAPENKFELGPRQDRGTLEYIG